MGFDYTNSFSKICCPYDFERMNCIETRTVVSRNNVHNKRLIPIYHCSTCGRIFTTFPGYPDMTVLTLDGRKITNIRDDEVHKALRPKKQFSPYEINWRRNAKPVVGLLRSDYKKKEGYLYTGICPRKCVCGHNENKLQDVDIICKDGMRRLKRCTECGLFYISADMYESLKLFFVYKYNNESQRLNTKSNDAVKSALKQKTSKDKKSQKNEKTLSSESNRILIPSKENDPYRTSYYMYPPIDGSNLKKVGSLLDDDTMYGKKVADVELTARDFLVRRSTFKCQHNNHKLQNVTAEVQLVNQNGVLVSKTFTAGFCPECKVYFIMDSVFQNLKKNGILMCRIQNEGAYLNGKTKNGRMVLAEESILMQYGYNVSQTEGLTELQRRKILSILVDLKILTKNDIISYLDFFINMRESNPLFERAVAKWEEDREFISEYRTGDYQKIGVSGIRRKY